MDTPLNGGESEDKRARLPKIVEKHFNQLSQSPDMS